MKKFATVLLALCTVLLLAFPAMADEVSVSTSADLVNALKDTTASTVKLVKQINLDATVFTIGANHTIDLNGQTLVSNRD